VLGYLCLFTGLSTLLVGVPQGSRWGWTSYTVLILATVGVLVLALFVVVELEVDEPLIDLRAAGRRAFVGTVLLLDALVVGLPALSAPAQAAVDAHLLAGVGTVVGVAVALTRFLGRRAAAPPTPPATPPPAAPEPELLPMLAWRPAQVVAPGGRAGRGGTSLTHFACRSVGSRRDHGPDRS
jgi:hypothetical protein